jgi:DNA-formamidopyrimidine glycosylase
MPERSEVKIVASQLNNVVKNKYLVKFSTDGQSRYDRASIDGLTKLKAMMPIKCTEVFSRGKKVIFKFDQNVYLSSSLSMEGKWLSKPGIASNLWLSFSNTLHDEGDLNGIDSESNIDKIYYDDTRHYGTLKIIFGDEAFDEYLKSTMGPDFIDDHVTLEQFKKQVKNTRLKEKKICDFLVDQKRFSGIGNYLRSEILYVAKIKPDRKLQTLSDTDISKIYDAILYTLDRSYKMGGFTLKSWKDFNGKEGKYKPMVYGRESDDNGRKVESVKIGVGAKKKTVYFCPDIQN